MMGNCFVEQDATEEIISNVSAFCAECYNEIIKNETIFYDMKNCCYVCKPCQELLQTNLDFNCEPISSRESSLFS